MEPAPTPATKTASSDEKNEERKVFLPVQVQYCATSPGASQRPVRCEVSESGHCGLCHNNLRNAPKVVNYERELKKFKDQIAATSDKEEKSKLIKRLNEVVFQAELEKLERELKKLNDQSAATSDKEEKSKLIERLSKVEK